MKRILTAAGLLVFTLVISAATSFAQAKKPNILVIFGDDIGQANVSAYSMGMMGYRTAVDFIKRQAGANKPFFCWMNTTRMHAFTHVKAEHRDTPGLTIDGGYTAR